jgi:hypothetical protein
MKNEKWFTVPKKKKEEWFSEYMVAGMVLAAWAKLKKHPKRLRVHEQCIKENKDGSAVLNFEAK